MSKIKKSKISLIITLVVIIVVVLAGKFLYTHVSTGKYLHRAKLGGEYLVRASDKNGKFIYDYDPITDTTSNSYNILRHAGTLYSLAELYEYTRDKDVLTTLQKGLTYLKNQSASCKPIGTCIVENNEIKLGGNGLAILAIAKYTEVTGDASYIPLAQDLSRWIRATQSEEGEFLIHKMNAQTGIRDDFISEYYPGEALFALIRLYEITNDEDLIDSANRGAHWVIGVRDAHKATGELPHDHWFLYALNELYDHRQNLLWVNHAEKLARAIVSTQHINKTGEQKIWNGGYYEPPRSTPTATRTEGLVAAYSLFQKAGKTEKLEYVWNSIKQGIAFQLRTQVTQSRIQTTPMNQFALGGFTESLTDFDIRIDYVQHNISSLLGAYTIKKSQQ